MAIDKELQIILRAALDQSRGAVKAIESDVKAIQKTLKQDETKIRLESFINTNQNAVSQLKKDIGVLNESIKGVKIKLDYELNLNKENKDTLKEKIRELSSKRDIPKIELKAKLDMSEEAISSLKKDVETLAKKLSKTPIMLKAKIETGGKGKGEEAKKPTSNLPTTGDGGKYPHAGNAISSVTKIDNLTDTVTSIDSIRKNIVAVQKSLVTMTKDGEIIKDTTEQVLEYEKAKKALYKEQEKIQKQVFELEKLKPKTGEANNQALNEEILARKELLRSIQADLDTYKVRDSKMDAEYESLVRIQEIKKDIANATKNSGEKDNKEAMSRQAYAHLTKLAREEFAIRKSMEKATGDELNLLQQKLTLNESLQSDVRLYIQQKEIENEERLNDLLYLRKQATLDLAQTKGKVSDAEALRIKKLGTEVAPAEENKIEFGNEESISQWAKEHFGANVQVTGHKRAIQDLNNEQMQFTVTTKSSKGLVTEYKMAVDKATGSVYQMAEFTREAGRRQLDFLNDMKIAIVRTIEWNVAMGMIHGSFRNLKEGVAFVSDIDKDLTQIAITTGTTREETNRLTSEYITLGKEMGKTVKEISSVNAELVRQGLSIEESNARMQTILRLSATGEMDVNETLSVITSSVNALGEEAEKTADVLLRAGMISASGADSIGESLKATASSARAAGMSIEEVSAIISTLIDVTQESPSSLGNSLKSIIARFSQINEETGETNKELNKVETAFQSVGVSFKDATGQIRPMYDLLQDLSKVWGTLDKNTKSYLATQSAGTRQQNRFYAIMDNFSRIQEINDDLQSAEGTLDGAYNTYLDSVEASANRARVALEELWINTIDSDAIKGFLNIVTVLTEQLDKFGIQNVAIAGGAIFALSSINKQHEAYGKMKHSISQLVPMLNVHAKTTMTVTKETEKLTLSERVLNRTASALGMGMKANDMTMKQYATSVGIATLKTVALNATVMATQAIMTFGLSVIVSKIVSQFTNWAATTATLTTEIADLIKESQEQVKTHKSNISTIQSLSKEYNSLTAKMGKNRDVTKLSSEEQKRYNEITSQLADIAPEIIVGFDERGNAIIRYMETLDELIEKEKEMVRFEQEQIIANSGKMAQEVKNNIKEIQAEIKQLDTEAQTGLSGWMAKLMTTEAPLNKFIKNMLSNGREMRVDFLEDKIANTTDAEAKREYVEQLRQIQLEQERAAAGTAVHNRAIQEQIDLLKQPIQAKMSGLFNEDGMSDAMKNVGNDFVMDVFTKAVEEDIETAGAKADIAIDEFRMIFKEIQDIVGNDLDISDNAEQLEAMLEKLKGMGMEADTAADFLYRLIDATIGSKNANDSLAASLGIATGRFKDLYGEVSKLTDMYGKLAKGENLSVEQMLDLIELHPQIAEYIATTNDLTLESGEILKQVMNDKYNALQDELTLEKQTQQQKKQAMQQELDMATKRLATYGKVFDETSDIYKAELEKVNELKEGLADADKQIEQAAYGVKAMRSIFSGAMQQDNEETITDTFDEITNKLQAYNDILKEINKNGVLSGDTNQMIMRQHQELVGMLGNEGEMRKFLIGQISEYEQRQQSSYQNMVKNSESYYNSLLKGNTDLFKRLSEIYDLDFANFKTLNDAKAQIANSAANSILNSFNQMYAGQGYTTGQILDKSIEGARAAIKAWDTNPNAMQTQYNRYGGKTRDEYQRELDGLLAQKELEQVSHVEFKPVNFTPVSKPTKEKKEKTYKKIDEIKLETDAYLKLSKAIEEVERFMASNGQLLEYATGKDRINLLAKEVELLDKKKELTSKLANEYRKERDDLQKKLGKTLKLDDGSHGIDGYRAYMKTQEDAINSVIKQLNATTNEKTRESLELQKETLEKNAEQFQTDFERYIELQLSVIPDLSVEWWDIAYEKFEKTLEMMETDLLKYEKKVSQINTRLNAMMTSKMSDRSDGKKNSLKEEYEIMVSIVDVYASSLQDIESKLAANSKMVDKYEKQLLALGTKRDAEYEKISRHLIMARAEQDKLVEAYEQGLTNVASQQQAVIDKYIESINYAKDETVRAFEKMREEVDKLYKFSMVEFETSIESILADLDKIDKIFMKNPEFNLSTEDARDELENWKDDILDSLDQMKDFESEFKDIMDMQVNSKEDAIKKQELLNELIQSQIEYETELKEIYNAVKDQILEMQLEHKKIEDALQNQIDIKQEELDALKEQEKKEEKIKSMLEKQLELMRAMDDTRYSYITGQGEEIFTYDQSKVMELQKQIKEMQDKEKNEEKYKVIEEEIKKMQENLDKTKEINAKELEVLQLAEKNLSSILGLLEEQISESLGEDGLEKVYEQMADNFIQGIQDGLDPFIDRLEALWKSVEDRVDVDKTPSKPTINTDDKPKTKSYTIQKGDTLAAIAKKFNTTVDELIKLNPDKKWNKNSMLYYNQKMNIPAFDTGGFTGNWNGNDGKLGILHKKELILNQDDTRNILDTVDIAKTIMDKVQGIGLPSIDGGTTNNNEVQQVIQNMNIYGIKDANDFKNEMNRLLRRGMPTLS